MIDYNLTVIARMEHEQRRPQKAEHRRLDNVPARKLNQRQLNQKRETIFARVIEMMAQIVPQHGAQPARANRHTT